MKIAAALMVLFACWMGCREGFDREGTLEQAGRAVHQQHYAEAVRLLRQVLAHSSDDAGTRYYLGLVLLRSGRHIQARLQFFRTVQLDSTHQGALLQLGRLAYKAGDEGEAVRMLERAVRAGAREARNHDLLAYLHEQRGRAREARAHLREAIRLDPKQPRYRLKLGVLENKAGNYDTAREVLEALAGDYPKFWEAHLMLGWVYRNLHMNEAAVRTLERALELKHNRAEIYYHLGAARLQIGQLEGAVSALLEAIGLKPDYLEAHYTLARAYMKLGQKRVARTTMARFRELQQDMAQQEEQIKEFISHWRKGVAEEAKGDYAAAVDELLKALRLDPDDLYTHILLYRAYRELGRKPRAEDMFRRINDLLKARSLGAVCTDLGVELIRRGEGEMAAEVLEEATAWDAALPRPRYYLVALYNRLGRPERGRPHIEALEREMDSRQ